MSDVKCPTDHSPTLRVGVEPNRDEDDENDHRKPLIRQKQGNVDSAKSHGPFRSEHRYPDTGESGDAYDVELDSAFTVRRVARLFGLTVGILSTSYLVYVFWLLLHGYVVPIYESNGLVATVELLMASIGLALLVGIMLGEMAGKSWPLLFYSLVRVFRRFRRAK